MREDPCGSRSDEAEIVGGGSAVILRLRFMMRPLEQWTVRREYLRRVKNRFDAKSIEIPFPHLTVYAGADKDETAPTFRVLQQQSRESLIEPSAP
jgi:small conductance mechanosensitive channel